MTEVVTMDPAGLVPDMRSVLAAQGMSEPTQRIMDLAQRATALFKAHAEPRGVYGEIGAEAFFSVYESSGDTPLHMIAGKAEHLALFIVTLGQGISDAVSALFAEERGDLAYLLDAVASHGAELAAEKLGDLVHLSWYRGDDAGSMKTLRYSPGYCGWELSGQKRIFDYLAPGDIGVSLTESFFMEPLKTISGVFAAGKMEIHRFGMNFPFCGKCITRSCEERMRRLGGF